MPLGSCDTGTVLIRRRSDADVESLCDLIRLVHATDGYPTVLQEPVSTFVVTANCLAAWVCELETAMIGHVALHTIWSDEVADLATSSLLRGRQSFASVSRLFIDPACRRHGLGEQLLSIATNEAHRRGLWPVLDVVTTYAPAIALYERCGWTRLGTIAHPMSDGRLIDEHVYASPEASIAP
jgi:GNAT superfamily N-acetyltransferase